MRKIVALAISDLAAMRRIAHELTIIFCTSGGLCRTMSVSVTTRQPRPGEVDGKDYHFIRKERFASLRDGNELLEYAEVFGNFYGTPKAPVEAAMKAGRDTLFDVDWQGGQQIRRSSLGKEVISIFILPPSIAELDRRLRSRGQDSDEVIAGRMAKSEAEISHWAEYDYVVVNDDLDHAIAEIRAILKAERLKRTRQVGLGDFVKKVIQRQ